MTRGTNAPKQHSIGDHLIFKASVNQKPKQVIHISPSIDPQFNKKKRASPGKMPSGPITQMLTFESFGSFWGGTLSPNVDVRLLA